MSSLLEFIDSQLAQERSYFSKSEALATGQSPQAFQSAAIRLMRKKRLKRVKKAERGGLRSECLSFASAIVDSWSAGSRGYWQEKPESVDHSVFAKLLFQLDDPKFVRRFLVTVIPADAAVEINRSFVEFCTRHGWAGLHPCYGTLRESAHAGVYKNHDIL